jgi:arylsulfatase A-like enzyme
VGFFAAHAQDNAKEQYLPQDWSERLYAGKNIPPPIHGDARYKAALPPFLANEANEGRVRYHWRFDTAESYQAYMTRYYRLITEVDAAVGRIVDELKAQGVYDNTVIVFIGDNGYFQADRGLADKWYPYEESIRVPLVVRDPRLPARRRGATLDQFALNIDVAPTIVSAAGAPVPAVMQGQDLSPLYLQAKPPAWRDEFFYEHPTVTSKDRIPSSQGIVRRDWKFIEWPEWEYRQLFDVTRDPGELRNLAGESAQAAQTLKMRDALAAWRERVR